MKRPRYPSRNSNQRTKDGYFAYPLMLSDRTWFYEDKKGLTVAHEFCDTKAGVSIRCELIDIPWSALIAAVADHRRAERAKARAVKR